MERQRQLGLAIDYELAQVLPALGRVEEVNALINERMRRPSRAEETPAALMMFAAREYRAHGFLDASNQLANRAIAWYDSRPDAELTEARQYNMMAALYHAGRWAEARDRIERAARQFKFRVEDEAAALSFSGRIAAQLGDTAMARASMERLKVVKPVWRFRGNAYFRALIAAGLGEKEMTVSLLQQAFAEGWAFDPLLHREIELQAMQDYPPLRELLWPKG